MYTLGPGQLNDPARLVAFGEKSLAANPDSLPALLLLSNYYVEDSKPTSIAKAVTYAQKVVTLAKANDPAADRAHKLSAGVAHSTLGYAYMRGIFKSVTTIEGDHCAILSQPSTPSAAVSTR